MVAFLAWKDDKGNPMDKDSVAQDKIFYADWIDDIAPELDFTDTKVMTALTRQMSRVISLLSGQNS